VRGYEVELSETPHRPPTLRVVARRHDYLDGDGDGEADGAVAPLPCDTTFSGGLVPGCEYRARVRWLAQDVTVTDGGDGDGNVYGEWSVVVAATLTEPPRLVMELPVRTFVARGGRATLRVHAHGDHLNDMSYYDLTSLSASDIGHTAG